MSVVRAMPVTWYHGDTSPRAHFTDQRWDRDPSQASLLEYGPGLYFTSDCEEATRYGPHLFQATLDRDFRLVPRRKPRLKDLLELYTYADQADQEVFLSNWDATNPRAPLSRYALQDTLYDALLALYRDLIRSADGWVAAIRALGYDGVVLDLPKREPPRKYLIVWAPEKLVLRETTC